MNKDFELTLLSEGQIWGNNKERQLDVISKYGTKAAITDLCILTGSYLCENTIDEDSSLKGRTSCFGLDLMMSIMMSAWSIIMVIGTTPIGLHAMLLFAQLCNLL